MSTAWDYAKRLADKHAGAGHHFVRLQNDGDRVVGVFCGDPFAREAGSIGTARPTPTRRLPEGVTVRPTLRVSFNFFVPTEGVMKIIEGGAAWFRDLVDVREKYGLDKWSFEVRRRGKKGDTKTKYSILPDAPVDDAMRVRIGGLSIHDLRTIGAAVDADGERTAPASTIDEATARAIADRLRRLPRETIATLLAEFKIERLRQLRSSELPRILRFLEAHEAAPPPAPFDLVNLDREQLHEAARNVIRRFVHRFGPAIPADAATVIRYYLSCQNACDRAAADVVRLGAPAASRDQPR